MVSSKVIKQILITKFYYKIKKAVALTVKLLINNDNANDNNNDNKI